MMACLFDPSGIRWWKSGVLVSGSNKMIAATFDGATFTHTIRRWLGWIRLINGHGIDDTDTAIGANYGSHVIVVCRVGVLYVSTYNDSLLCGCGTVTHTCVYVWKQAYYFHNIIDAILVYQFERAIRLGRETRWFVSLYTLVSCDGRLGCLDLSMCIRPLFQNLWVPKTYNYLGVSNPPFVK